MNLWWGVIGIILAIVGIVWFVIFGTTIWIIGTVVKRLLKRFK
jgi:hypothetical protein